MVGMGVRVGMGCIGFTGISLMRLLFQITPKMAKMVKISVKMVTMVQMFQFLTILVRMIPPLVLTKLQIVLQHHHNQVHLVAGWLVVQSSLLHHQGVLINDPIIVSPTSLSTASILTARAMSVTNASLQ